MGGAGSDPGMPGARDPLFLPLWRPAEDFMKSHRASPEDWCCSSFSPGLKCAGFNQAGRRQPLVRGRPGWLPALPIWKQVWIFIWWVFTSETSAVPLSRSHRQLQVALLTTSQDSSSTPSSSSPPPPPFSPSSVICSISSYSSETQSEWDETSRHCSSSTAAI